MTPKNPEYKCIILFYSHILKYNSYGFYIFVKDCVCFIYQTSVYSLIKFQKGTYNQPLLFIWFSWGTSGRLLCRQ